MPLLITEQQKSMYTGLQSNSHQNVISARPDSATPPNNDAEATNMQTVLPEKVSVPVWKPRPQHCARHRIFLESPPPPSHVCLQIHMLFLSWVLSIPSGVCSGSSCLCLVCTLPSQHLLTYSFLTTGNSSLFTTYTYCRTTSF